MKIIVRKEHIEEAKRKDSHHCMIADAIRTQLGAQFISVDVQSIRYNDPTTRERLIFLTPHIAQNAILRWDRGVMIQPFAFYLERPVKITPIRQKWTGKKSTLQKARKKYEMTTRKLPRLVKRTKPKVTRFREFGVRKLTVEKGA